MLLLALRGESAFLEHFLRNGGQQTIASYGSLEAVPEKHLDFFEGLKLCSETEDFFFAHAGLNGGGAAA